MLRILLISVLMLGTVSVADSYYTNTNTERVSHQNGNDVLKLKLEIYQLKEKNIELKKVIADLKLTTEQRQAFKRKEAIQDFRQQLRNNRSNQKVSLSY